MKGSFSSHSLSLAISFFMLPLSSSAISDIEMSQLRDNPNEKYIYCDRDHTNLAEFITEISKLDQDKNSPIWQLHEHINKGFTIGKQDAIVDALVYAEELLDKNYKSLSPEQKEQFMATLWEFINEVIGGQLACNLQTLFNQTRSLPCHHLSNSCLDKIPQYVEGKIIFENKVTFNDKVKCKDEVTFEDNALFKDKVTFRDKVKFKDNVLVEGSLSVADETINCNLTVGCNINIHNSIDPTVGNINKDGVPFIHNFGINNTFVGLGAGNFTTTGQVNTSCGALSLPVNTSGLYNTGMGGGTLMANTSGSGNTACGTASLLSNSTGSFNTSIGFISMISHVSGDTNTAIGSESLNAHTVGSSNVAVGSESLSQNITGSNNIALGAQSGNFLVTGDNNIYIANNGMTTESGNIRIGTNGTHTTTFIQGIATSTVTGSAVLVDPSSGQLGVAVSSRKFKHNITDMNIDSANIYNLRPVTFVYNNDISETKNYGLIAEEVNAVFPEIVVYDADGQPQTVQYHVLPVLLLNEVQKQQVTINDLVERVNRLEENAPAA